MNNVQRQFEKIGADVDVVVRKRLSWSRTQGPEVQLNVRTVRKKERFEIAVREDVADNVELQVLEIKPYDRHLVLLSKLGTTKNHFLCGHDERHLFVAQVGPVSTVAQARDDLKPKALREKETGLNIKKRNQRKQENYIRQGEWFFMPVNVQIDDTVILKNEPITRPGGGKPHIAQFAFRKGGQDVMVSGSTVLTPEEYKKQIESKPEKAKHNWRSMKLNPELYVQGTVRHPDHATIFLDGWHRVFMNTERRTEALGFLD